MTPGYVADCSYFPHLYQYCSVWLSSKGHTCFKKNVRTWLPRKSALKAWLAFFDELIPQFCFIVRSKENYDNPCFVESLINYLANVGASLFGHGQRFVPFNRLH